MNLIGVLSLASMLASAGGRSLAIAVAVTAPQADADVPTVKEQALMEHACRVVQAGAAHEAYDRCLEARLLSLRADFGRDLTRLSPSARASIDAACTAAQASRGRDGYLECLTGQLASRAPARATLSAKGGTATPAIATVAVDSPTSDSEEWSLLTVGAAAVAAASAMGALVFFRARRAGSGNPKAADRVIG
jgi:hypothetical protein